MARIENHKYSIEEAFRECFYIVPDYQREYVWTDKEVHQLLEDIGEQIDVGATRVANEKAACEGGLFLRRHGGAGGSSKASRLMSLPHKAMSQPAYFAMKSRTCG